MSFSLARLAAATARSAAAAPMRASGAVAPARAGVAPSKVVVRNMGGLNPKTFSHNSHFHVSSVHKNTGMFMATVMWLWVFYRAKEDAIWVLGFVHPWDAHPHHHHEHIHFVQEEIGEPTIVGEHEEHDEEDEDE
mmetsp:Transcript_56307/g.155389  ORF Transcript_56307/g.155389 Transcript_56307/m.155389 type:complete len:135 (-) Transcript_56307:354-758(-)